MDAEPSAHSPINRRLLLGAAGVAGIAALAAARAKAGPLNPPSGAIGSTGKTITEAEPRTAVNAANTPGNATSVYRITQAGGYYLTANILATPGRNAIEIAASGVTIDLNGFQIGSFGGLAAIVPSSPNIERIVIRNGGIFNTAGGILLPDIPSVVVEGVSVESCSGDGVRVGPRSLVSDCSLIDNTVGVYAGNGSCVRACRAEGNSSIGIVTGSGSTISGCTAAGNGNNGFEFAGNSVATACTARQNAGAGFRASNAVVILGCTAEFNQLDGFSITGNSSILDCTAFANTSDGIFSSSGCTIRGNTCIDNGSAAVPGAGIRVNGLQNRIEQNHCVRNYRGMYVSAAGNFIAANTCSDSTLVNWEIAAGNKCLVIAGLNAAAISGDAGGTSPGSTSPWANFTF